MNLPTLQYCKDHNIDLAGLADQLYGHLPDYVVNLAQETRNPGIKVVQQTCQNIINQIIMVYPEQFPWLVLPLTRDAAEALLDMVSENSRVEMLMSWGKCGLFPDLCEGEKQYKIDLDAMERVFR